MRKIEIFKESRISKFLRPVQRYGDFNQQNCCCPHYRCHHLGYSVPPAHHCAISLIEIANVFNMWSSKTHVIFSHVKPMCLGHVFHMWNFTYDFSHVFHMWLWNITCDFHMGNFICEISHVKFHMGNFTWEISYVKRCKWYFTCEKSYMIYLCNFIC